VTKRLKFSTLDTDKHQRPSVYIPITREEKPKETTDPKKKDRGVLIIEPDGSAERSDGNKISQN
jgi:hypothetical protein